MIITLSYICYLKQNDFHGFELLYGVRILINGFGINRTNILCLGVRIYLQFKNIPLNCIQNVSNFLEYIRIARSYSLLLSCLFYQSAFDILVLFYFWVMREYNCETYSSLVVAQSRAWTWMNFKLAKYLLYGFNNDHPIQDLYWLF